MNLQLGRKASHQEEHHLVGKGGHLGHVAQGTVTDRLSSDVCGNKCEKHPIGFIFFFTQHPVLTHAAQVGRHVPGDRELQWRFRLVEWCKCK